MVTPTLAVIIPVFAALLPLSQRLEFMEYPAGVFAVHLVNRFRNK